MRAAFLIRCSTDQQDFTRQLEDLQREAERMGYEYSDDLVFGEHITGKDDVTKGDRRSIKRLFTAVEDLDNRQMDVLLISEVSRLSRDSLSGRYYIRRLCNAGMPTYFRDKRKWTMDPLTHEEDEEFLKALGSYFDGAAEYLKSMKTQVASGRRSALRRDQLVVGHVPLGYKKAGGKDKRTKSTVIVDPETAPIVEDMFNMYLQEGASMKSVSLQLTEKYGTYYSVSRIQQTISRELYCTGEYLVNMTDPDDKKKAPETFAVKLERPLVSKEVFGAVTEKRIGKRTARAPYPKQKVRLLTRLIKCPDCGHSFSPAIRTGEKKGEKYRMQNGKPTYTWRCMSRINNATDCDCHINLNNERLEGIMWMFIKRELVGFASLEKNNKDEKIDRAKNRINQCREEQDAYEKSILTADRKIDRARSLLLEVPPELVADEKKRYAKTLKEQTDSKDYAKSKIEELKDEISHLESRIEFLTAPIDRDSYLSEIEDNEKEKRRLFQELIKSIVPYRVDYRIVVLEVDTVDGMYYVLFDANRKKKTIAYYFSGVWGRWQASKLRYEAYAEGDYFMLMNASDLIETEDVEYAADFEEMQEICQSNGWVINADYENPKSVV